MRNREFGYVSLGGDAANLISKSFSEPEGPIWSFCDVLWAAFFGGDRELCNSALGGNMTNLVTNKLSEPG
jgi:hypothetical protein